MYIPDRCTLRVAEETKTIIFRGAGIGDVHVSDGMAAAVEASFEFEGRFVPDLRPLVCVAVQVQIRGKQNIFVAEPVLRCVPIRLVCKGGKTFFVVDEVRVLYRTVMSCGNFICISRAIHGSIPCCTHGSCSAEQQQNCKEDGAGTFHLCVSPLCRSEVSARAAPNPYIYQENILQNPIDGVPTWFGREHCD